LELKVNTIIKPANKRGVARLAAVQALYQMDIAGTGILEIIAEYETYRLGQEIDEEQYLQADAQWFRGIVAGTVDKQRNIDPMIQDALTEDWPLSRLDATLRALMRAGCWEVVYKLDVPTAVVINEYVDIAKAFFGGDEPKIANAVLDRIAKKQRPEKIKD
jgi:transcription antitermination protein NusB